MGKKIIFPVTTKGSPKVSGDRIEMSSVVAWEENNSDCWKMKWNKVAKNFKGEIVEPGGLVRGRCSGLEMTVKV